MRMLPILFLPIIAVMGMSCSSILVTPSASEFFGEHEVRRVAIIVGHKDRGSRTNSVSTSFSLRRVLIADYDYDILTSIELSRAMPEKEKKLGMRATLEHLRSTANVDLVIFVFNHHGVKDDLYGELIGGVVDVTLLSTRTPNKWFFGSKYWKTRNYPRTLAATGAALDLLLELPKP